MRSVALILIVTLAGGCGAPRQPPTDGAAPRPGVADEVWDCRPANGSWQCERRRDGLR